ncbi:hypothetical protein NIES2104_22590 [Leptolyngbya sp. NIES-2104]|nr:hypothetical protein NIES2104_22590 [Leptolyngbya sp. NIES-2104]
MLAKIAKNWRVRCNLRSRLIFQIFPSEAFIHQPNRTYPSGWD